MLTQVTKAQVEEWLGVIGCTPVDQMDPQAVWHVEFDYPTKTPHRMHVVSPKQTPIATIIAAGSQLKPDHLERFAELDEDAKTEFIWDLRHALNRLEVDFRVDGAVGPLDCPKQFQISVTRYPDGLNLDSFAMSLGSVYKTELHVAWLIEQHLGGTGPTPGGRFDFKKLGID
jgi:hypothetical protein